MEVISDRKVSLDINTDGATDYFEADVVSFSDYYPFGMQLPDRHFEPADDYRHSFQGQEKDDEIKGVSGSSINYKYRMHDTRVGRFFAVDPLTRKYPHYTPYSFSGNKVIAFVELEGLEEAEPQTSENCGCLIVKTEYYKVEESVITQAEEVVFEIGSDAGGEKKKDWEFSLDKGYQWNFRIIFGKEPDRVGIWTEDGKVIHRDKYYKGGYALAQRRKVYEYPIPLRNSGDNIIITVEKYEEEISAYAGELVGTPTFSNKTTTTTYYERTYYDDGTFEDTVISVEEKTKRVSLREDKSTTKTKKIGKNEALEKLRGAIPPA